MSEKMKKKLRSTLSSVRLLWRSLFAYHHLSSIPCIVTRRWPFQLICAVICHKVVFFSCCPHSAQYFYCSPLWYSHSARSRRRTASTQMFNCLNLSEVLNGHIGDIISHSLAHRKNGNLKVFIRTQHRETHFQYLNAAQEQQQHIAVGRGNDRRSKETDIDSRWDWINRTDINFSLHFLFLSLHSPFARKNHIEWDGVPPSIDLLHDRRLRIFNGISTKHTHSNFSRLWNWDRSSSTTPIKSHFKLNRETIEKASRETWNWISWQL